MSITWRIVVKICLNPCPWYCGCSSVSGSRYDRCCHQTNNNKTWSGTQPPNIHGRPSIILTSTAQSGTVLQKYHFAKCGDQFSASSAALLTVTVFISIWTMKSLQERNAFGSICKPHQYRGGPVSGQWWCHYVTLKLPVHSVHLSGSIVGSSYWIITPNFADNPFARIVQHTVRDKAGSGATPQYPD